MRLDDRESAIQLLLETEPSRPEFLVDSLRACLIAATVSPAAFQDSIKLVRMNLWNDLGEGEGGGYESSRVHSDRIFVTPGRKNGMKIERKSPTLGRKLD